MNAKGKVMNSKFRFVLALLIAGVAGFAGCATTKEVREIVAQSNAAMVMVDVPGLETEKDPDDPDRWKAPVERIERLIAQHPDQPGLVAALRVRQAMLLTVYGQFAAANEAWSMVGDTGALGARDRALHALHSDLVWWFERAPDPRFGNEQVARAGHAVARFASICDGLPEGSDIRFYLETMRALIALKAANSVNTTGNPERQQQVGADLVAALQRLEARYDDADEAWVKANGAAEADAHDQPLARLRARVWLLETIRAYRQVAADKGLSPAWEPEWLGTVAVE